ncbi:MAG: hypothetical protein GY851_29325 [bacterium]|nr:hypothetical protein [bacterium]
MNRWMGILTVVVLAVCATLPALAQNQQTAIDAIAQYKFGQSREALTVVEDMARASVASDAQRQELAAALAGLLGTDATYESKQFVCRQLSLIGSDENVAAVAALLADEKTADMARYALERIAGKAAGDALLAALAGASGAGKVGIINSLGVRETPSAVAALAPLAEDGDAAVSEAAIVALGRIGGKESIAVLAPMAGNSALAADSYLLCADRLLAAGKESGASKIYNEMYEAEQPRQFRVAALQGLVKAQGKKSVPMILDLLASDDASMQAVAAGLVRTMPAKGATKAFAGQLGRCSPSVQVLMLDALADRGDAASLPAVTKAAESEDASVQAAALSALGAIGDESVVSMLADAAAGSEGPARKAAQASLTRLQGDRVDEAIVEQMGGAGSAVHVELIRAATERRTANAVPSVLAATSDADEGVRKAALSSLAEIGTVGELPAVVDCLVKAKTDGERKQAAKTVVTLAKQVPDGNQRAAAVLAALPGATDARAKCALLGTLPLIGDNTALDPIRTAMGDANADVKDAAIRALAEWPNAAPVDDLRTLATDADAEVHRILALRGFVRMVGLPSDRPALDTLKLYQDSMEVATRVDEKKLILSGMANVGAKEVVAVVEAYLDDEALKAEAKQALGKIRSKGCTATASHNAGAWKNAFDKNPGTRWDTGTVMKGGEWFQLDVGWDDARMDSIVLDTSGSAHDYPRGYDVYVSNNPDNLGDPVATGEGKTPVMEIKLGANSGRYLRIVQTGKADGNYWSIHEMTITMK